MTMRQVSTGAIIAIAATGLLLTLITAGVLTSSQSVTSTGTITSINVGVYSDSGCTQNCTSINWGTLAPGNSTTQTVYIKNTGTASATLSMTATNWVPSNANTYLALTWNRAGYVLAAGSSVSATFTLTASASAGNLTTFSFNIVITGTQ
jgi:hypothetical protein